MAGATYTDVDMDQIAREVSNIHVSIESIVGVRDMLREVLPGLDTCWQGEAKEVFSKQFTEFIAAFTELAKGYESLNEELDKAGSSYKSAYQAVKDIIGRLPN